jgi:hypothetical protein
MSYKEYTVKVFENETKFWYLNGKRHREDGPAVEYANGEKRWFLDNKRHREDGPAEEYANGDKVWYLNDERHREDGPAVELANQSHNGGKYWYLNGQELTEKEFLSRKRGNSCDGKIVEIDGVRYQLKVVE